MCVCVLRVQVVSGFADIAESHIVAWDFGVVGVCASCVCV